MKRGSVKRMSTCWRRELVEARTAIAARSAEANRAAAALVGTRTTAPAMPPPSNGPDALPPAGGASEMLQLVPYGEVPMAGERLEALRRQLSGVDLKDDQTPALSFKDRKSVV